MTVRSSVDLVILRRAICVPECRSVVHYVVSLSLRGIQYRGRDTAPGSAFSPGVIGRALPVLISLGDAPSNVAKRWSYWWNSFASYSGR